MECDVSLPPGVVQVRFHISLKMTMIIKMISSSSSPAAATPGAAAAGPTVAGAAAVSYRNVGCAFRASVPLLERW